MTELVRQLGALGVFLLMVPESACIPIPSEATLLFSGFAVSRHLMSLWLAVAAATAGNVLGSVIAYGIGGAGLMGRIPGAGRLLARYERTLDEHALRTVFVARLLPLARTFVSLPAGARRVPLGPFISLTAAGCALWALAFVVVGDAAGTAWAAVGRATGQVTVSAAIVLLVVWGFRRLHRRT